MEPFLCWRSQLRPASTLTLPTYRRSNASVRGSTINQRRPRRRLHRLSEGRSAMSPGLWNLFSRMHLWNCWFTTAFITLLMTESRDTRRYLGGSTLESFLRAGVFLLATFHLRGKSPREKQRLKRDTGDLQAHH